MTPRLAGLILALLVLIAPAARAAPVDTGHLKAELIAQTQAIAPGQTIQVALRQQIDKGWHTYWRNPGDSGEATKIAWTLPPGWSAGDFVWQPPEPQPAGPLVSYGYSGEVILPMTLTAPADAPVGQPVTLRAAAAFLVCEEICIPEDALLELTLPVQAQAAQPSGRWAGPIARALEAAPRRADLAAVFENSDQGLRLAITGAVLAGANLAGSYFFPFDGAVIDHAAPQSIDRGPQGLTLGLTASYAFQMPEPPQIMAGVLKAGDAYYEIEAQAGPLPAEAAGLGPPATRGGGLSAAGLGLPLAMVFAVLGGLILNLMPCVFPILAMKAASLAGHAHEAKAARGQGLAFLAGVLATFLTLAGVLIIAQAAGAAVGWGFQLQSPPVVAALALLMLAVALNLSGVFEIGTSLQGVGSGLAGRGGLAGAFFVGVLAVVVAAPCTAPFMAPALGWALTQNAASSLLVFAALGLGFAAPFVAVSFAPGLLARLPRPGPWMDHLRKVLAFPMYGAAAWLLWVLTLQAGPMAMARLLAAAIVLALAAWLFGLSQVRSGRLALRGGAAVLAILAVVAVLFPAYQGAALPGGESSGAVAELPYEPYSAERLAELRAQGAPVFVNFTAAWCVTCQVNEQVALARQGVAESLASTGAVYLKGDWTRKDDVIAAELARHGRAGVPLYLVYDTRGSEPVILPQILTEGLVVRALEAAAG
ncbi:MAG: protein-disulfide reductase DsbD family protein [Phenylobacterium sp.]|uniref:protein-disulfide reductase DsbD family protein n=1 Tax=Phenylobacterium sp. TaxID=1871053 RepID=UPI0027247955|nr:protein-disulfide reductase DsbD domain-containing protein [Phenylobacterium sp.]MDO8901225.1 protein-disulfide reductase DsbD family protein [Phenylobacterium sp.]